VTDKDRVIAYRIDRAQMSLSAAEVLLAQKMYPDVLNRLYYACFYAVSALLLSLDVTAKTHAGLRSQFNLHIIHAGVLPKEYGDLYNDLIEAREETDYDDLIELDLDRVYQFVPRVRRFIDTVGHIISSR